MSLGTVALALWLWGMYKLLQGLRAIASSRYFQEPPEEALERTQAEIRTLLEGHDRERFEDLDRTPLRPEEDSTRLE